jgi:hypothetical protein
MYNLMGTQLLTHSNTFADFMEAATDFCEMALFRRGNWLIIIRRDRRDHLEEPPDSTPTENGRQEKPPRQVPISGLWALKSLAAGRRRVGVMPRKGRRT